MLLIIALLCLGVMLLLVELVLPGGVVGGLGFLALVAAVMLGFMEGPMVGLIVLVAVVIGSLAGFWAWLTYLPKSRIGGKLLLSKDGRDWRGYDPAKQELVGKHGVAQSTLRPSGVGVIDGRRHDVESLGDVIERGMAIEVVRVEGNRVIVRLATSA